MPIAAVGVWAGVGAAAVAAEGLRHTPAAGLSATSTYALVL